LAFGLWSLDLLARYPLMNEEPRRRMAKDLSQRPGIYE
jgi:hypothetical protein